MWGENMEKRMRPSDEAIKNFYIAAYKEIVRILKERKLKEEKSA